MVFVPPYKVFVCRSQVGALAIVKLTLPRNKSNVVIGFLEREILRVYKNKEIIPLMKIFKMPN